MAARVIDNDLDVSQAQILTPADYGIDDQPCNELDLGNDLPIVLHSKPQLEKCTHPNTRAGMPELSSTFPALDVRKAQQSQTRHDVPGTPPKPQLKPVLPRCEAPDSEECAGTPASDRDSLYSTGADSDSLYSCSDSCAEEDEEGDEEDDEEDDEEFCDTFEAPVEAHRSEELKSMSDAAAVMMNNTDTTIADDDSDDVVAPCEDDAARWLQEAAGLEAAVLESKQEPERKGEWWQQAPAEDASAPPQQEESSQDEPEEEEQFGPDSSIALSEAQEELNDSSALFENMGHATRIAFAIDISGSMKADVNNPGYLPRDGGTDRISVVRKHLSRVLQAMQSVKGAAFGICLFNSTATPLFGGHLLPATKDNVELALTAIAHSTEPCRGNGAEATCLETCLSMAPDPGCTRLCSSDRAQAVYFLGDGGWEAEPLIAMAEAKAGQCVIHSINFFSEGGGLERIAHITGGTYKEIKSPADIDC